MPKVISLSWCAGWFRQGPRSRRGHARHRGGAGAPRTQAFHFHEESVSHCAASASKDVDIRRADIEVVARNKWVKPQSDSTMRWICAQAALCLVQVAAGAETCASSTMDVLFETIRKPDEVREWRRRVACNDAREGNVQNLRPTNENTVTLVRTMIHGTVEGGVDKLAGFAEINESAHVCWAAPPQRTDPDRRPSRTDSSHQPSRTNPSDCAEPYERAVAHRSHQGDRDAARAEGQMPGQRGDAGAARASGAGGGAVVGDGGGRVRIPEVRAKLHQARGVADLASPHRSQGYDRGADAEARRQTERAHPPGVLPDPLRDRVGRGPCNTAWPVGQSSLHRRLQPRGQVQAMTRGS